jgi:peptidoglycan/LPS O-acetylase OafA/YrhL
MSDDSRIPALDGIRALACLAVVASHAGGPLTGVARVDAFFVLSGFLITRLLVMLTCPLAATAAVAEISDRWIEEPIRRAASHRRALSPDTTRISNDQLGSR